MVMRVMKIPTIRWVALIAVLLPAPAAAQPFEDIYGVGRKIVRMNHGPIHAKSRGFVSLPTEPGQAAFSAIQEIVDMLEADSRTDWAKVNLEALRQHLIDMNNVTLAAEVKSERVEGGVRFRVTGAGSVTHSIRRMLSAHAAIMQGVGG
jgi:hypothetical protein